MTDDWIFLSRFPGYLVMRDGTVASVKTGLVLRPQLRNGYLRVQLRDPDGRRRWMPVHTLILEAFRGPRPSPRHHGAHGPGGRTDNSLANLRWATPEENEADKRAAGTAPRGTFKRKVHRNRVAAILRRIDDGMSRTQVAKLFGLHRKTISRKLKLARFARQR